MNLTVTKLYRTIKDTNTTARELWRACDDYINLKKDLNIQDTNTGQNFLHVITGHGGHVVNANSVPCVYILASSGIHLDTRDNNGDTCLHKAARVGRSYKVIEALIRCGADPTITNNQGLTPAEVIQKEKPQDWQNTLHWMKKYHPGLKNALTSSKVDIEMIERLLRGWCRTKILQSDGDWMSLTDILPMQDSVRRMVNKYEATNEFVISLLAGKPVCLNGVMLEAVNVNTKDFMNEGTGAKPLQSPKPLLMAVWQTEIESSVDTLLSLGVNTSLLYSKSGTKVDREPLFFHLISKGRPRVPDSIIHKILRVSDMKVRDQSGQTILYKAILNDFSRQFVKALIKYGVNIAARDKKGRTARDICEIIRKVKYLTDIDEHVLEIVRECDIERLQQLVLEGYDHIVDVTDDKGLTVYTHLKQLYTLNQNKDEMLMLIEKIRPIQDHLSLMFRATDTGGTDELRAVSSRKLAGALDKCGRTILHKAILNKKKDMIKFVVHNYSQIIDLQDNLGRCALHYAYLVTEGTSLVNYLLLHGANPHILDWAGRTPECYHIDSCGKEEYLRLQMSVNSFTMDVYLSETNFEQSLQKAVENNDFEGVEQLIHGLTDKGDVNRYANILFHCVDTGRQQIAVYLIHQGMRTDIYKQYETCNSRSSACSTYTCDHTLTSLYNHARNCHCYDVLKAITSDTNGNATEVEGRPTIKGPSTIDQFSMLGML